MMTFSIANRLTENCSRALGASASTNSRASLCGFATAENPAIGCAYKLGGTTGFCKILAAIFTKVLRAPCLWKIQKKPSNINTIFCVCSLAPGHL